MNGKKRKIDLRFILDFYDAFLREPILNRVAEALEVPKDTLFDLARTNPHLKLAKEIADERREKKSTLANHILGNLSPEAKKKWDEIQFWDQGGTETPAQMKQATKKLRQEIFLHALLANQWNMSEACRLAGVNRETMGGWTNYDAEFRELIKEVRWHQGNFYESKLVQLVDEGYPGAILFANKTFNADRGYNEKLQVEHTGQIGGGIDVNELDLDLDTRRKILEAIRKKKETDRLESMKRVSVTPQLTESNEQHNGD